MSAKLRRLYLFDGDKTPSDKTLVEKTKAAVAFLPRRELENYLLIPEAIMPVLNEEAADAGNYDVCNCG
jgi:hypothetical protein